MAALAAIVQAGDAKKKSKKVVTKELSDLVVYCRSAHLKTFAAARGKFKCYDISSLAEKKGLKLAKVCVF